MKKIKEKVINILKGKFEVTKITKKIDEEVGIIGDFLFNGKNGRFVYILGVDERIESVDYVEEEEEDIYKEVSDWVDKHVEWDAMIKVDGKEI